MKVFQNIDHSHTKSNAFPTGFPHHRCCWRSVLLDISVLLDEFVFLGFVFRCFAKTCSQQNRSRPAEPMTRAEPITRAEPYSSRTALRVRESTKRAKQSIKTRRPVQGQPTKQTNKQANKLTNKQTHKRPKSTNQTAMGRGRANKHSKAAANTHTQALNLL